MVLHLLSGSQQVKREVIHQYIHLRTNNTNNNTSNPRPKTQQRIIIIVVRGTEWVTSQVKVQHLTVIQLKK